jgi:tripartite-type tricarboxylate transporter receptor subunit TctC
MQAFKNYLFILNKRRKNIMEKKSSFFLLIIGIVFIGCASAALGAEKEFPTKPIEFICPWEAGSGLYMAMRVLSGAASEILGRPVLVIAKPGAGGSIGAEYVAKAKPDGYTLLMFNSGTNGVTLAVRKVRYKNADFEIYCQSFNQHMVMVTHSGAPWNSLEELVAYAKKHPGDLKYGTSGIGTSSQLAMELFNVSAGIKIDHLPFLGGPQIYAALVAGHVPISIYYYATIKGLIDGGKLKVLAQANEKRNEDLPNIPTFIEKGYPDVVFYAWYGVAGPKGIPKEISSKLKDVFSKVSQDKSVIETLKKLGWNPYYRAGEEFTKFVEEEVKKYEKIVREANIRIE